MNQLLWQTEGQAKFRVGKAFYNRQTKIVRDLGVLAATAYRQDMGSLRVLDALAGCGVRSLRYFLESHADYLWVNEGNPQLHSLLQQNLTWAIASYQLTHLDAHRVFFKCYGDRDYYDLVDVDCFGTAVPYLSTMLWATKIGGLIYLTSTDGRTLTGHLPDNSIQAYGAIARAHPAAHEQALRLLIGSVQQQAATKGLGVEPLFSLFTGKTYRLMLRLTHKSQLNSENYGFIAYCHNCGNYQTVSWRKLGKVSCNCSNPTVILSGAMWLGELHQKQYIERLTIMARQWQWREATKLLSKLAAEIEFPPYFYTLGEIGKRGKLDIPKRSHLIKALQQAGYRASTTHISDLAIKTTADIYTCIAIAKQISTL
ncbi:tRNA (guanine-N1)-methyltransferase [Myxosarcina sp. GI1(2024)]